MSASRTMARWGLLPVFLLALAAAPSFAQDDEVTPWTGGKNWLTLRGGYAKSGSDGAGNGFLGYGFGFTRMLGPSEEGGWKILKNFALSFYVHHEVLGRFGRAMEIEVPATVEFLRHFDWGPTVHPYVGIGAGAAYRKTYRTGDDLRTTKPCYLMAFGANSPLDDRHMLGFDVRLLRVDGVNDPVNPVFGAGSIDEEIVLQGGQPATKIRRETTHWSVKLAYSITY